MKAGAIAGAGGGGLVAVRYGYKTDGDTVPQNTGGAWQLLTGGPSFSIPASAGDYLEFEPSFLMNPRSDCRWDYAVVVGGIAVRYASTGTNTPGIDGDPSLYFDTTFEMHGGGINWQATPGDLDNGNFVIQFAVKCTGAPTTAKLYNSANYPLRYAFRNYGSGLT